MPKPTLLDALEAATDEDLRTIDSEIEQLQRKLASLSDARRILARRLGVDEPAKRERKAKPETTDPSEFFESVFALLQDRGPTKTAEIAAATGVSGQAVGQRLKGHAWFQAADHGRWAISRDFAARASK